MTDYNLNKVSAFLIIKEGTTDIAKKTLKVNTCWTQIGTIYGHTLANKAKYLGAVNSKKKYLKLAENTPEFFVEKIEFNETTNFLDHFCELIVKWIFNEYKTKEIVLDVKTYEEVTTKLRLFEQESNLRGSHLKVMDYGEGVCFLAPTHEDSIIFKKFLEILENKE